MSKALTLFDEKKILVLEYDDINTGNVNIKIVDIENDINLVFRLRHNGQIRSVINALTNLLNIREDNILKSIYSSKEN